MTIESLNVRVSLAERSYDIAITSGGLSTVEQFIGQCCNYSHAVVISDTNVMPLYGDALASRLRNSGQRIDTLTVPAGEGSKSLSQLNALWESLLAAPTDRKSVVIAVGGGVVGDLAGFAAASFARGLQFIQIPTTLLAQVDSSVGGKLESTFPMPRIWLGRFGSPPLS